jgi:hypothetical protein
MKLKEGFSDNEFKELILSILDDNSEYKKDQYKFLPIDNISRDGNMEKKYLRLQDYIRNKTRISPKMWTDIDEKLTEIINEVFSQIVEKKLCARGKKYIAKRKAAGEKSSAYLSGRAVKVCKGQMKG